MSGMANTLSSISNNCLQQVRDHHHHHPGSYQYMFADPLHSLSPSYAHAARVNQAMAHAQPPTSVHHPANYTPSNGTAIPQATGTGKSPIIIISSRQISCVRVAIILFYLRWLQG